MGPETPPISDGVPEHIGPKEDEDIGTLPTEKHQEISDGIPEHIPSPNDPPDETSDGVPEYIPPNKRTPNP